jgi:UDP-N-acetyl-D-glucosamine dehydrogenase
MNLNCKSLRQRIMDKKAEVGVIGLGYVGLPLVKAFLKKGFSVTGFDIDRRKVDMLNRGEPYIKHITTAELRRYLSMKRFKATADFAGLAGVDAIIICVPTPLDKHRNPDLSFVVNTAETIAKHLRKGHLVVLESTTYPGTTDEVMLPILERGGFKAGRDFFLAFSPERENPGDPVYGLENTPKVVGGITKNCLLLADMLYSRVVAKTVPLSSTRAAESAKLLENIFRCVNIALVNELKMIFDRMGIDVWEVIRAASTKPFGFMPFYPGPGLGGHCIPIDPFYLTWKAREVDYATRFIELAGEINAAMPYYVVNKTLEALAERGKPIKGSRILVLGIAYKKDIDDQRESPSLKIINLLKEKGAEVDYNDPFVPKTSGLRGYPGLSLKSVALTAKRLRQADAVIIATDHTSYDYDWIVKNAKLVVDSRNAVRGTALNVIKA